MNNPQNNIEWYLSRLGILTASVDFYTCVKGRKDGHESLILTKAAELIAGDVEIMEKGVDNVSVPAIDWGNSHEDVARAYYEISTGYDVDLVPLQLHPDHDLVGASPDGLINDDGGCEVKCPQTLREHLRHILHGAPDKYYFQIQGNMWVTGRSWWDFVSYHPYFPDHLKLYTKRYFPDQELFKMFDDKVISIRDRIIELVKQINSMEIHKDVDRSL